MSLEAAWLEAVLAELLEIRKALMPASSGVCVWCRREFDGRNVEVPTATHREFTLDPELIREILEPKAASRGKRGGKAAR